MVAVQSRGVGPESLRVPGGLGPVHCPAHSLPVAAHGIDPGEDGARETAGLTRRQWPGASAVRTDPRSATLRTRTAAARRSAPASAPPGGGPVRCSRWRTGSACRERSARSPSPPPSCSSSGSRAGTARKPGHYRATIYFIAAARSWRTPAGDVHSSGSRSRFRVRAPRAAPCSCPEPYAAPTPRPTPCRRNTRRRRR